MPLNICVSSVNWPEETVWLHPLLEGANSSRKSYKPSPSGDDDYPLPAPGPVTVCGRCLAPLGPGKPHPQPCGWTQYRENVFKLASIDQRTQDIIASRIIGNKVEDMSPDDDTIILATRGSHPLRLSRPKPPPSKEKKSLFTDKQVPVEEFCKLAQSANLKSTQVEKVDHNPVASWLLHEQMLFHFLFLN